MAARLTDRQKKKIVADYIELQSFNAVAKIHGVSRQTVKNIIDKMPDIGRKLQQKKEENTEDALRYLESRFSGMKSALDLQLAELNNAEKAKGATLNQNSTSFGTIVDKMLLVQDRLSNSRAPTDTARDDALSMSLRDMAEELESDD